MPKQKPDLSMFEIHEVGALELDLIIEFRTPYGKYWTEVTPGQFVAVDNTNGDAWTEEFDDKEIAIDWLNKKFERGGGRTRMESAKDVGKNVEVNEYQDSLNELYENATNGEDVYIKQKHIKGITECRDVLQELVDKEKPKKPIRIRLNRYEFDDCEVDVCPNCKNIEQTIVSDDGSGQRFKRCHECGQKIDWSKDER